MPLIIANRLLNYNRSNIIFWSCGQDVVPLSYFPSGKNIKRLISKLLGWFTFMGINYLATGPELMVDYYHQRYKIPRAKILTLYNDISLNRFHPLSLQEKVINKEELLKTNKKVMLFVHTFNKCRGADILPLIAQEIKNRKTAVKMRIMVRPEHIDDVGAMRMARDVAKRVEETLDYPGQIRITVIRETRSTEYAK